MSKNLILNRVHIYDLVRVYTYQVIKVPFIFAVCNRKCTIAGQMDFCRLEVNCFCNICSMSEHYYRKNGIIPNLGTIK
jgi:hypothetical protein